MLARAGDFIFRNARLLERYCFAAHFEGAATAPVRHALAAYQNDDGGFGNALEPDKRVPASQPVDVQVAFEIMDAVGDFDMAMVRRACAWLTGITSPDGGLPFSLPSANDYPHAPWWQAEANPPPDLNPTAAIAGVLLKHRVEHPWLSRAEAWCWSAWAKYDQAQFHTLMPMLAFLEHAGDQARAGKVRAAILERVAAPGAVALDPGEVGYVKMPLEDDGGWPISWDTVGPGVTLEWRGLRTIEALRTLRAYGKL